jgi:hypothetical protein
MKIKNLYISTLCICLLTTLTNCKEKQSDNINTRKIELKKVEKLNSSDVVTDYIEIEKPPTFPGGDVELLEFINKNLNKKIVGNLNLKEGKVVARFQIDTIGQVINLRIVISYNQAIDSEFNRVLKLMPKWKSGKLLINRINGTWVKIAV